MHKEEKKRKHLIGFTVKLFKKGLFAFIDLLLYGHFWIAAAALAMGIQTELLVNKQWNWSNLHAFIACGTLSIYALHRLVALGVISVDKEGRFQTLFQYRKHILFYAFFSGLAAAYFFFQLPFSLQSTLLIPCGLALAYVVPFLNGKRLRDLPFLKIFLIAITWAWITVVAPSKDGNLTSLQLLLMLIERAAFIFAITIPFDIRDLAMDKKAGVPTLPSAWGTNKAKRLAYWSLVFMLLCVGINVYLGLYTFSVFTALLLSALVSAYLISETHAHRHDYYFSGLLDGLMILQFLLVWGLS